MNINLDMVLMLQLIQYVHAVLKLKLLNISSCDVICGALRDLVPFVQFREGEKHP